MTWDAVQNLFFFCLYMKRPNLNLIKSPHLIIVRFFVINRWTHNDIELDNANEICKRSLIQNKIFSYLLGMINFIDTSLYNF